MIRVQTAEEFAKKLIGGTHSGTLFLSDCVLCVAARDAAIRSQARAELLRELAHESHCHAWEALFQFDLVREPQDAQDRSMREETLRYYRRALSRERHFRDRAEAEGKQ